jgi:hypothetical protein
MIQRRLLAGWPFLQAAAPTFLHMGQFYGDKELPSQATTTGSEQAEHGFDHHLL